MIGVDIITINRIENSYNKFGSKFLSRFLNKDEIKLAKSISTMAGFWSCKEAVSKAFGTGIGGEIGFLDIEIYKDRKGAPKIKMSNEILLKFNVKDVKVSITHDKDIAAAVAVLVR